MKIIYYIIPVIAGWILDLIIGDPHCIYHPVRLIGWLIGKLDKMLYKDTDSNRKKYYKGMLLWVLVMLATGGVTTAGLYIFYRINVTAGLIAESVMCYQLIAAKSLKDESMKVYYRLKENNIEKARYAVSMIVGRDTEKLDETGITKAAVETVAENTSDGIAAPLFYIVFFGAAGGFMYKAVNTMDSMIGYKNDKYMYFGRFAAKSDDVVNFIPARLASWIMIAATGVVQIFSKDKKYNMKDALRIYRRDKHNHSSPNSAHTESVCAGALGVRLAGDNYYFGKLHKLQSFFPAGDEQTIVYEVTGRVVPPAAIPLSVGCVVSNVATIYGIGDAFEGEPFTRKFLTVTGEVAHPTILRVPVGTPVSECIALAGGTHLSRYIVVNGGPMMGKMIPMEEVPNSYVTKTMSGLIVLPEDSAIARRNHVTVKHMINQAKSACIQCSFCSQMCPRALLGHPIRPNKIMRKLSSGTPIGEMLNDPDVRNAALCCECGICEIYACPMGLKPRTVNSMLKKELAKAGIRYQRPEGVEYTARPERGMSCSLRIPIRHPPF